MADPVLSIRNISKAFGAVEACKSVSLDIQPGEIHALIGPNGAGKSTLIKQIAGGLHPDSGSIHFNGQDVTHMSTVQRARLGLGRSFQVSAIILDFTVMQNIMLALHGRNGTGLRMLTGAIHGQTAEAADYAARTQLDQRLNITASDLAHGERRRLELAMALALQPKVFLLDEPMAGLGNEGAAELTSLLNDLRQEAPILLVEHDMDAVFALADRISVLVYGEIIATGTTAEIRSNPAVRTAYLGEEEDA